MGTELPKRWLRKATSGSPAGPLSADRLGSDWLKGVFQTRELKVFCHVIAHDPYKVFSMIYNIQITVVVEV